MPIPLTHPSLRSTATLTAYLGVANLLVLFLLCILVAADGGSIPIDQPEAWFVIAILILIFPIPGIILMRCAVHIHLASKTGVTVALVIASILTLIYGLVALQNIAAIYIFARFTSGGIAPMAIFVSLVIATSLLVGFIFDIVKLSRSYGVINEIRHGGPRGFEPLMSAETTQTPPPSPAGE